ncbi:MAG: EAL domain-containing protein [Phormidesmis sp.]
MTFNVANSSRCPTARYPIVLAGSQPPKPWQTHLTMTHPDWGFGIITGLISIMLAVLWLRLNWLTRLLKRRNQQIERLNTIDGLTGLANRQELYRVGTQKLASPAAGPLALLHLNLDRFRLVNDALGSEVSDQILYQVGHRLRAEAKSYETIARIGSDTFSLLLRADREQAKMVAERLLVTLNQPFYISGHTINVSGSLGIAIVDRPAEGAIAQNASKATLEFRHFLNQADIAMSWAKSSSAIWPTELLNLAPRAPRAPGEWPDYGVQASGRLRLQAQYDQSRCRFFEPEMQVEMKTRSQLQQALKRAVSNQELRVHYQPIVDLETEQTVGFETLVRWQHPKRGLLLPHDFLPVAEKIGLIVAIDRWVIETVCQQLTSWRQSGVQRQPLLSVNLSGAHMSEPGLVDYLSALLTRFAIPARQLNLEITESVMIAEPQQAIETILALKALGLSISLDDFGTGYSSLGYLHRLPVDALKIDRSFLYSLGRDPAESALTTLPTDAQPERKRIGQYSMAAINTAEPLVQISNAVAQRPLKRIATSLTSDDIPPSSRSDEVIVRTILLMAEGLNIQVVAEGIERSDQLQLLKQMRCRYGQGYLFSQAVSAQYVPALMS